MVELEEIVLYGIYWYKGKSFQLKEIHFEKGICEIAKDLLPYEITLSSLNQLGFIARYAKEESYKDHKDCRIILRPASNKNWIVQLPGIANAGYLKYIHEVQRLWYAHFQEHLYLPPNPSKEKVVHKIKQDEIITERYTNRNREYSRYKVIPAVEDPYYFTVDTKFLIRSEGWAVWSVSEKSPLFRHAGRDWGLTLVNGSADEDERIKAGKWLKNYMQENC